MQAEKEKKTSSVTSLASLFGSTVGSAARKASQSFHASAAGQVAARLGQSFTQARDLATQLIDPEHDEEEQDPSTSKPSFSGNLHDRLKLPPLGQVRGSVLARASQAPTAPPP